MTDRRIRRETERGATFFFFKGNVPVAAWHNREKPRTNRIRKSTLRIGTQNQTHSEGSYPSNRESFPASPPDQTSSPIMTVFFSLVCISGNDALMTASILQMTPWMLLFSSLVIVTPASHLQQQQNQLFLFLFVLSLSSLHTWFITRRGPQ